MSAKQKSNILVLILLVGVVFFSALAYWLWVRSTALPVLGEIESFSLETVEGKAYQPKNDKLKLVMFYEEECNEMCKRTHQVMESMQSGLNEEQLLGKDIELLTIIMSTEVNDVEEAKAYKSQYSINSNGWEFLTGSPNELEQVKKQIIAASSEADDTYLSKIYLIDKKGRIRGIYEMDGSEPVAIETMLEEVKNLVRVQPTTE